MADAAVAGAGAAVATVRSSGSSRSSLRYPDLPIDVVLEQVAGRQPDAPAVIAPGTVVSFAELDRRVGRFAVALAVALRRVGAPPFGNVVAVASELSVDFVVAYHGVLRSGNVVAPLIPLLPARGLAHVLRTCGARVAVLTPPLRTRVDQVAGELPDLAATLLLGQVAGPRLVRPCAPSDLGSPACIQFTSGTTGAPKAVLLSHRNLTVNAFQTADAHQLDAGAVTANHLPTFHPMHMNSALVAGATQVLCPVEDGAEAVRMAARHGVTHLYSLPVRLGRLAGHPDLPRLRAPSLRVIASGGSALAPPLAEALARHFGVPVVQGYGLAETSPLTHSDLMSAPRPGSVGPPVADTECRLVDVETRVPLVVVGNWDGSAGPEPVGEVQVRGPQVMLGYLGDPPGAGLTEDGWLSTGDVGRIDADGRLHLVDRIKDVFKHDNWLVSPTALEATLLARPEIADACVVDRPDEVHGAVAHALLVPAPGADTRALASAVAAVNDDAPYYERVGSFEATLLLPRSPQGKVPRAVLRARLADGRPAVTPLPHPPPQGGPVVVTMVNKFTVFGDPDEFERVWMSSADFMRTQPGFRNFRLMRSVMDPLVYVNIAEWESAEDHQRVLQGPDFLAHIKDLAALATPEPNLCTTVAEAQAEAATR
ncbi:MAG TPA: AMP-binding protein [Acidimicrobiales bacterium]|nr:AMP-binding protein [Acidimicrobiales bacterium]